MNKGGPESAYGKGVPRISENQKDSLAMDKIIKDLDQCADRKVAF